MPLYRYKCNVCHEEYKWLSDELPPEKIPCRSKRCDNTKNPLLLSQLISPTASRQRTPSTYQNVEVLDNGLSARPVERYADAERIFRERAEKNTLENQENG